MFKESCAIFCEGTLPWATAKLDERSGRDPFGQLLAGMEKNYADLLFDQLKFVLSPGALFPTDVVVMYGMCIIYESDRYSSHSHAPVCILL